MAKSIMLQGTASNVGKSILVAALCRIFHQDGYKVAPFKAQNMTQNSITREGYEMGSILVLQAQAAGVEPRVEMNPILLKPASDASSRVVVLGRPLGEAMSARDYHLGKNLALLTDIKKALKCLRQDYEIIVIEGAGSPAEVNLKERDLANMRTARLAEAPVLLVADIDRGGALASIVGTLELLDPEERDIVQGIIINKFRGDLSLLKPALDFLEEKTGKPVLGVIPFIDLNLPEEDSLCCKYPDQYSDDKVEIETELDRLADTCRSSMDMKRIYEIVVGN
ncbi:MAG TPA: cobyric acid synthase [Syntrophomonadaceae bacterium]|nr:cobyric acid synthase [Syntrophomonadaceae bacterium]